MRIDGSNSVNGPAPKDPRAEAAKQGERAPQVEADTTPSVDEGDGDTGAAGDTIEFSAGAQELLGQNPAGNAVRPEMVERAKALLQSGAYNDKGAIEKTAEKIAGTLDTQA